MSSCIVSAAEASSISWKQVCLFQASEQFYICWWYKSNFSPFLVVTLLINSCSKNPRFNLCFPVRLISLQGLSQSLLHSAATLLRPSIPGQNMPHLNMSQQNRAASPAANREGAERRAWQWKHSPSFSSGQDAQRNATLVKKITRKMQQAALDLEVTRSGKVTSSEILTGINSKSPR